jgi:hypothetical protein
MSVGEIWNTASFAPFLEQHNANNVVPRLIELAAGLRQSISKLTQPFDTIGSWFHHSFFFYTCLLQ